MFFCFFLSVLFWTACFTPFFVAKNIQLQIPALFPPLHPSTPSKKSQAPRQMEMTRSVIRHQKKVRLTGEMTMTWWPFRVNTILARLTNSLPLWLEVGRRSFSFQGTFTVYIFLGLYRPKINFVNYQFEVFFTLHFFLATVDVWSISKKNQWVLALPNKILFVGHALSSVTNSTYLMPCWEISLSDILEKRNPINHLTYGASEYIRIATYQRKNAPPKTLTYNTPTKNSSGMVSAQFQIHWLFGDASIFCLYCR